MPSSGGARRRRRLAVLRGVGFAAAVVLGGIAVWLIVTSTSQKRIEIGVLTGLWGLLLGSYAVFGSRSPVRETVPVLVTPPPEHSSAGRELDLRKIGEIERAAVAAARLEFQEELQEMLRREVQAGLAVEVAGLRTEVAALRNELVEKVGGQLRLERIETTRLIGSDLEALQHELRQLRQGGSDFDEPNERTSVSVTKLVPPVATVRGADTHDARIHDAAAPDKEIHDAEIVDEPAAAPQPAAAVQPPAAPQPAPWREPVPEPMVAAEPVPEPAVEPEPVPAPVAVEPEPVPAPEPVQVIARPDPPQRADPFASMPRITPFTDFDLEPIPASAPNGDHASRAGRHSSGGDDSTDARGRRHRAEDSANDVLARILAREQT